MVWVGTLGSILFLTHLPRSQVAPSPSSLASDTSRGCHSCSGHPVPAAQGRIPPYNQGQGVCGSIPPTTPGIEESPSEPSSHPKVSALPRSYSCPQRPLLTPRSEISQG